MRTNLQTNDVTKHTWDMGSLALVLLAAVLSSGCLSKPSLQRKTYAFQAPAPAPKASGPVLAVRSVGVLPLYAKEAFVYRTGPESYETDAYAGFLIEPNETIAMGLRARLLATGQFRDVVEGVGYGKATQSIAVNVTELCGDFSQTNQPAAVLSLRVISLGNGDADGQPTFKKDYSRRMELKERTAAAVMSGWDAALAEIAGELATDLTKGK